MIKISLFNKRIYCEFFSFSWARYFITRWIICNLQCCIQSFGFYKKIRSYAYICRYPKLNNLERKTRLHMKRKTCLLFFHAQLTKAKFTNIIIAFIIVFKLSKYSIPNILYFLLFVNSQRQRKNRDRKKYCPIQLFLDDSLRWLITRINQQAATVRT